MLFEKIFKEFKQQNLKYLVIGGIAVNLHGFGRATGDLDIMVCLSQNNLKKLLVALKNIGIITRNPINIEDLLKPEQRALWAKEKNMIAFSVVNANAPLEQIDILIENPIDFDKAYEKRDNIKADDIEIPLISIDELIELKKCSARQRDQIDIAALEQIKRLKQNDSTK